MRKGKANKNAKYKPPLSKGEMKELRDHLQTVKLQCIVDLMDWIRGDQFENLSNVNKLYCADFFRALSTSEPIYYICPSKINDILIGGQNSIQQNEEVIKHAMPAMWYVIFKTGIEWKQWFWNTLKAMATKSKQVFQVRKDKIGNNGYWEHRDPTNEQIEAFEQWWKHGTCFAGPPKRQLPVFDLDIERAKQAKRQQQQKQKKKEAKQEQQQYVPKIHRNKHYKDEWAPKDTPEVKEEEPLEQATDCDKKFPDRRGIPRIYYQMWWTRNCVGRHHIVVNLFEMCLVTLQFLSHYATHPVAVIVQFLSFAGIELPFV